MSTQIVRLANGDSIQVRTGVLRGSGPAGPPGPRNTIEMGTVVTGVNAAATLVGDAPEPQVLNLVLPQSTVPGPAGSISDFITVVETSSNTSVAANTGHTLAFNTTVSDELSMLYNTTTMRPTTTTSKVITFSVRVWFMNNGNTGSGFCRAWVVSNGSTTIGEEEVPTVASSAEKTVLNIPVIRRFVANETFQICARHSSGSNILIGAQLSAIRVGAGPAGPTGPAGPSTNIAIGTVSTLPTGTPATASVTGTSPNQTLNLGLPKGDTGPPGSGGSGYQTIHELDGTGGNTA